MGLFDDIISGIEKGLDDAAHEVVGVASTVGNTIEGGVDDLYHAIFGGGSSSSGGGSVDTGSDVSLTDIRWEGMSNEQLAQVVNQLSQGQGAGGMQEAADVLSGIAAALQSMDDTLRQQLQASRRSLRSRRQSLHRLLRPLHRPACRWSSRQRQPYRLRRGSGPASPEWYGPARGLR